MAEDMVVNGLPYRLGWGKKEPSKLPERTLTK